MKSDGYRPIPTKRENSYLDPSVLAILLKGQVGRPVEIAGDPQPIRDKTTGELLFVDVAARNGDDSALRYRVYEIGGSAQVEPLEKPHDGGDEVAEPEATDGASPENGPPSAPEESEEPEGETPHDWPDPDENGKYPDLEAAKAKIREEAEAEQQVEITRKLKAKELDDARIARIVQALDPLTELEFEIGRKRIATEYGASQSLLKKLWRKVLDERTKRLERRLASQRPDERGNSSKVPDLPEVLGYSGDRYAIRSRRTGSVLIFSATQLAQWPNLYTLAEPAAWLFYFPSDREGKISTDNAVDWIIKQAKNPFDATAIRGRGAWIDGGRPVYNDGERIYFGHGESLPIDQAKVSAYYERRPVIPIGDRPATVEETHEALSLVVRAAWTAKIAAPGLVIGWCAVSGDMR